MSNSTAALSALTVTRPVTIQEILIAASAMLFSKFSIFQLGIKDLKPRTGSWRVLQILTTINLAFWIGVIILFWLGTINPTWNNLSIAFIVPFSFSVIQLSYLHLYHLPQKKSSTQP